MQVSTLWLTGAYAFGLKQKSLPPRKNYPSSQRQQLELAAKIHSPNRDEIDRMLLDE